MGEPRNLACELADSVAAADCTQAQPSAEGGRREEGASAHHILRLAGDVAAARDDGAARVLDEGPHDEVRPDGLSGGGGTWDTAAQEPADPPRWRQATGAAPRAGSARRAHGGLHGLGELPVAVVDEDGDVRALRLEGSDGAAHLGDGERRAHGVAAGALDEHHPAARRGGWGGRQAGGGRGRRLEGASWVRRCGGGGEDTRT